MKPYNCEFKDECTLYSYENGRCQFFYRFCSTYKQFRRIEADTFREEQIQCERKMWEEKDLVTRLREEGGL